MPSCTSRSSPMSTARLWLPVVAGLCCSLAAPSLFTAQAVARPPRAERVATRIAERRYARLSIAETRTARAEARVAEIAPVVPVPPPPRPATLRRLARAGVPLGDPTPPAAIVAQPPAGPVQSLAGPAAAPKTPQGTASTEAPTRLAPPVAAARPVPPPVAAGPGAWTLDADDAIAPATADVSPDGTRSVLSAGGSAPATPALSPEPADRPGPAVTQPPVELLPTPGAK